MMSISQRDMGTNQKISQLANLEQFKQQNK